eukprot:591442_1
MQWHLLLVTKAHVWEDICGNEYIVHQWTQRGIVVDREDADADDDSDTDVSVTLSRGPAATQQPPPSSRAIATKRCLLLSVEWSRIAPQCRQRAAAATQPPPPSSRTRSDAYYWWNGIVLQHEVIGGMVSGVAHFIGGCHRIRIRHCLFLHLYRSSVVWIKHYLYFG